MRGGDRQLWKPPQRDPASTYQPIGMAAGVNGLGDANLEKLWSVTLQQRIGPRVFLALNRMAAIPISTFMIFPRRMASVVVERGLALLRVHPNTPHVVSSRAAVDWIPPSIGNQKFGFSVSRIDVVAFFVIAGSVQGENRAPLVHFPFAFSPPAADAYSRIAFSRSVGTACRLSCLARFATTSSDGAVLFRAFRCPRDSFLF